MSRTDAHTPYWVQLAREGVEDHDHRFGECDFDYEQTKPQRSTWRVGRHHTYRNCKKYTSYTVECTHLYRMEERYSYYEGRAYSSTLVAVPSRKRHCCTIWDGEGNIVTHDKPRLPNCHEVPLMTAYVNKGDDFKSYHYDEYSFRYRSAPSPFTYEDNRRATHVFSIYIFDENAPCSCDDFPKNRFQHCGKVPTSGKKYRGYSYYCNCGWCNSPAPSSRSNVKQALREIAKNGMDEEGEYLDYEDVYRRLDYR